jgi:hypothetical protein
MPSTCKTCLADDKTELTFDDEASYNAHIETHTPAAAHQPAAAAAPGRRIKTGTPAAAAAPSRRINTRQSPRKPRGKK